MVSISSHRDEVSINQTSLCSTPVSYILTTYHPLMFHRHIKINGPKLSSLSYPPKTFTPSVSRPNKWFCHPSKCLNQKPGNILGSSLYSYILSPSYVNSTSQIRLLYSNPPCCYLGTSKVPITPDPDYSQPLSSLLTSTLTISKPLLTL